MESSITVPCALLIAGGLALVCTVLLSAALIVAHSAVRRRSGRRDHRPLRYACSTSGCTRWHGLPPSPKHRTIAAPASHRQNPRPDGPFLVALSVILCGFGLIKVPKGHRNQW